MEKKFKKVKAPIIGADGNIFNLIGICSKCLEKKGYKKEALEMYKKVQECKSYDEALCTLQDYVIPVDINYDKNDDYEL